jgi:hypothetical protein
VLQALLRSKDSGVHGRLFCEWNVNSYYQYD